MTFSSACSSAPPIVSADTSCERFRHISASTPQLAAMKAGWDLWESYAIQVAQHNLAYEKACLAPKPGP